MRATTEFVEQYLHDQRVWNLDDKEQNVLTYEVNIYKIDLVDTFMDTTVL